MILHCQEMYMAGCEEYEGIELTQDQIKQGCEVMPSMSMCTNEVNRLVNQVRLEL